jgi:hypothetical protein
MRKKYSLALILVFLILFSFSFARGKKKTFCFHYFYPGLYQLEQGQKIKGWGLLGLESVSLLGIGLGFYLRDYYFKKYMALTSSGRYPTRAKVPQAEKDKYDRAYARHKKACALTKISIVMAIGTFCYNFLEVNRQIFFSKRKGLKIFWQPPECQIAYQSAF